MKGFLRLLLTLSFSGTIANASLSDKYTETSDDVLKKAYNAINCWTKMSHEGNIALIGSTVYKLLKVNVTAFGTVGGGKENITCEKMSDLGEIKTVYNTMDTFDTLPRIGSGLCLDLTQSAALAKILAVAGIDSKILPYGAQRKRSEFKIEDGQLVRYIAQDYRECNEFGQYTSDWIPGDWMKPTEPEVSRYVITKLSSNKKPRYPVNPYMKTCLKANTPAQGIDNCTYAIKQGLHDISFAYFHRSQYKIRLINQQLLDSGNTQEKNKLISAIDDWERSKKAGILLVPGTSNKLDGMYSKLKKKYL